MRSTYNNFLLDGLDNNEYGTSNQGYSSQLVQPSPDAIAEFQVITTNYSAEYGRVGGAVVNAVMSRAPTSFTAPAYEFVRNTDLNAVGFMFNPVGFHEPTLQRNQFGATIGGPIIKNKLFFFGDYEGYRQLQRYLNFDSIPDVTDRRESFPSPLVDPLTGTVYPADTQIPIASIESVRGPRAEPAAAAPNGPGRSNDDESAAADPRLQRQVRRQDRRPDQRQNDGLRPLQPAQGSAVLRAGSSPAPRAATATVTSTPSIRTRRRATPGPSLPPRSLKPASDSPMFWPAKSRRIWAGPAWNRCSAFRACPRRPVSPAA